MLLIFLGNPLLNDVFWATVRATLGHSSWVEQMAYGVLDSYLVKRGRTYHYRRRVPADVQAYVGLKWWKKSLKTGSEDEAKKRARHLADQHEDTIATARGATPAARHAWLTDVSADAAIMGEGRAAHAAASEADRVKALAIDAAGSRLTTLSVAERQGIREMGGLEAFYARTERALFDLEHERIRLLFGRNLGQLSAREGDAREAVLQAMAPHIAKDQHTLVKLGLASPESSSWEAPENPRVNTAMEKWFVERKQGPTAVKRHRIAIRRFVEMHGNVPVHDITKPMVRDFLKRIETLPDHRKLATDQRGGLADPGVDIPRVAAPTVERHLISIKALLKFCIEQDWLTVNVATGLKGPKDTRPKASRRRPLTRAERNQLLARAVAECGENGDMTWLIRLAAYTGARLEELAQLARTNVREIDGTQVIEVDDLDGRRVKTASSVKEIPLHPAIRDGFLAWVRSGNGRYVFASFRQDRGDYVNRLSGDFGRLMDRAGLSDPRLVFHSLRHTLKREMSNADIDPDVRRTILGHAPKDAHDGYAGHSLEALAEEFARLPALFD